MKTVFDQVKELLDTANAALGEIDRNMEMKPELMKQTKGLILEKLEITAELFDSLKSKAEASK